MSIINPELIFDIGETVISSKGKVLLKEPQRSYCWQAEVIDPNKPNRSEDIMLFLTSASVPASTTEMMHKRYMGQEYTVTGQDTSPKTFTMTLWDDDTLYCYRYMNEWYGIVNDPMYSRSVGYKKASKDIHIKMKNNYDNRVTGSIYLKDCVISEVAAVPIDYADSNNFTFDVTFSYKHKIINKTANDYRIG